MCDNHYPRPRWWLLYLCLPLAGVMFWLIERAHSSDMVRESLEIGALLIVFTHVELWRKANAVALLHHPGAGKGQATAQQVAEVTSDRAWDGADGRRRVPGYTFCSDLFKVQMESMELPPSRIDEALPERLDAFQTTRPLVDPDQAISKRNGRIASTSHGTPAS